MPSVQGTRRLNIEFFLTPEQELHVFAQWREKNPAARLEDMNLRRFQNALREVIAEVGWKQAVETGLPEHIELKKMDYKAQLKGIIA